MAKNYKYNVPPTNGQECNIYLKDYPTTAIPATYNTAGNYFEIVENGLQMGFFDILYWEEPPLSENFIYQVPQATKLTSYVDYDEGYNIANGVYLQTINMIGAVVAELDYNSASPFDTLKNNNIFGNKSRFTKEDGTAVSSGTAWEGLLIDHLTRLEWYTIRQGVAASWAGAVQGGHDAAFGGYIDWRAATLNELQSIRNNELNTPITLPFTDNTNCWAATTVSSASTYAYQLQYWGGIAYVDKTDANQYYFVCRNYYNV